MAYIYPDHIRTVDTTKAGAPYEGDQKLADLAPIRNSTESSTAFEEVAANLGYTTAVPAAGYPIGSGYTEGYDPTP